GVRAAAIVSTGGILKAADVPGGVQGERLAFAASAILTTAEAASEDLRQGKLGRLVVEVDDRRLIVMGAGEKNMLVVLTERGNFGPIAAEAEKAVDKIKEILGE
ncbi:MAG TPA: roadblock/LC7 domain-containing protein, partial [Methanocella sp.]|nr:roadblock/LC7 domain-containing protein [Methanocella sp.]